MIMQRFFWIMLVVIFSNCQKENNNTPDGWVEGRIIGLDFRRCACCGGWFIELEQDTVRAFTLPENFEIDPQIDLPINVLLTYENYSGPCEDFEPLIVVDQIVEKK